MSELSYAPTKDRDKELGIARVRGEVSALALALKYAPSAECAEYLTKRLNAVKFKLKKEHSRS